MEDDLKILLDHTQILNLSLDDQTIFYQSLNVDDLQWKTPSNGRRPPMEDDIKY